MFEQSVIFVMAGIFAVLATTVRNIPGISKALGLAPALLLAVVLSGCAGTAWPPSIAFGQSYTELCQGAKITTYPDGIEVVDCESYHRTAGGALSGTGEFLHAVVTGLHPDGCTSSPDTILRVQVGISGLQYEDLSLYPCNLHDYRFHIGGDRVAFWAANVEFYQGLLACVRRRYAERPWWQRPATNVVLEMAEARCGLYWYAVSSPVGELHFNWCP